MSARARGDAHDDRLRHLAQSNRDRLLAVFVVGALVMSVEVLGGLLSNSLVLLADAAHYAMDLIAVLLAFLAITWALKAADRRKTFGYHRAEVVAAFVNAIGLWIVSAFFIWHAAQRLLDPPEVSGGIVFWIGALSFVANALLAALLRAGSGHNLNVRAAYLHVLSDVLGSAAALVAGGLIHLYGFHIADPLLTLFVTVLILVFTWRLTRDTVHILLEGSPVHVDVTKVRAAISSVEHVRDVHDLHVWTLASGVDSLSAHVVLDEAPTDDRASHDIHTRLRDDFGLGHVTIQVEAPECPCETIQHRWTG